MTEKKTQDDLVTVLSVRQILLLLLRRCWMIVLSAMICGGACYYVSSNFITPRYESTVAFYVNNNSFSDDNRLSSSDLWVSQSLVDTYMVILDTGTTMREVIDQAGVDLTTGELEKMIQAKIVENTEIFTVSVTGEDPEVTQKLADAIATVLLDRIDSILAGATARVVDHAVLPAEPSEPSPVRNAVSGALFGAVFCASVLVLRVLLSIRIRKEEDIARVTDLPILTSIPAMALHGKRKARWDTTRGVGAAMSQDAAKGMQLLCLKLPFCFPDGGASHIIGVSSAMAGEGKSTTAVNLAYSLAAMEKRVLLIDCDMRRPTVHEKLAVKKMPGLSEYLIRRVDQAEAVKTCATGAARFDVITSGQVPPNPIELLSSQRMVQLLESLRDSYDYVILDLPPVGEVGDAIVTAKLTDGTLLVVRQDHCTRPALQAAIHEFDSVEGRLLGVIRNDAK